MAALAGDGRRAQLTIGIAAAVLAVVAVTPALGHDRNHVARPGHNSGHNDDKVRAAKIEQLYQLLLKAPLVIAGQESVDHIFDASVEGRVTPVGEFHDREGVNEATAPTRTDVLIAGGGTSTTTRSSRRGPSMAHRRRHDLGQTP